MPIEIRELHIRVAVSAPPEAASTPAAPAAPGAGGAAPQNEALVAECVEQVLRILQHKTER
jgi:3-oxoacyl-ACP reductase-like protein